MQSWKELNEGSSSKGDTEVIPLVAAARKAKVNPRNKIQYNDRLAMNSLFLCFSYFFLILLFLGRRYVPTSNRSRERVCRLDIV